jgi:hypothetical protein
MAGQHPEVFAGAAAWVPVYDLARFYEYNLEHDPEGPYPDHIETICGGDPTEDDAAADCAARSPVTHMAGIAEAELPLYLGHGIDDEIVRPDVTLQAFNDGAAPAEPIAAATIEAAYDHRLPEDVDGQVEGETFFGEDDPEVRFARSSGASRVVLFDGEHDKAYHPTLRWMAALAGPS